MGTDDRKYWQVREEYWAKCHVEADRIMKRFDIKEPRCGFSCGLGWMPIVERALEKMIAAGWDRDLHQVKQKFCMLRIYIGKGMCDDVDNPVKRFFRKIITFFASSNKVPSKIRILLWDLSRTRLFDGWRPNAVAAAIREAETLSGDICEVCGLEREKKGVRAGWALCDSCEPKAGKEF